MVGEEGGDRALTPKGKIRERGKVSKRSNGNGKEVKLSAAAELEGVGAAEDEVEGDSLVVSTAEELHADVLKATKRWVILANLLNF